MVAVLRPIKEVMGRILIDRLAARRYGLRYGAGASRDDDRAAR